MWGKTRVLPQATVNVAFGQNFGPKMRNFKGRSRGASKQTNRTESGTWETPIQGKNKLNTPGPSPKQERGKPAASALRLTMSGRKESGIGR